MSKEKILYAYCKELGQIVNIMEASRIYLSLDNPPKDFTFYCANDLCRKNGVRISAVNYNKSGAAICQIPHFRNNTRQKEQHDTSCEWCKVFNENNLSKTMNDNGGQYKRFDSTDLLINKFIFHTYASKANKQAANKYNLHDIDEQESNSINDLQSFTSEIQPQRSTSYLDILVSAYNIAKEYLSEEDFNQYYVSITHIDKKLKIKNLFHGFQWVLLEKDAFYIMHGNASMRRYGEGFSFKFYEQVNHNDVSLYISSEFLKKYKFRKYIIDNLNAVKDKKGYFKVYFIPDDVILNEFGYSIIINNLNHLAFTFILPKNSSTGS